MIKLNSKKGITLVSLIITIIIIAILSTVVINSTKNSNSIAPYNKMIADITLLEDKVRLYYNRNGEKPIKDESEVINGYYEIDLEKLENITLNFGTDQSDSEDKYLVNDSLEVYYQKGIEKNGQIYHTND